MSKCVSRGAWHTKALIGAAFLLVAFFRSSPASAGLADIERQCSRLHPSMTEYFARRDCIKVETQKEEAEQEKQRKEELARPCIAGDIARMEGLAEKAKLAIKQNYSLEEAQSVLAAVFGYKGAVEIPDDNLKERVLIHAIRPKCDSSFYFLSNLRIAQDGALRWYRTWAQNAPVGYKPGYQAGFSIDFDQERAEEQRKFEAAKLQEQFRAASAKQERELEEQRQRYLNGVKITNSRVKCLGTCSLSFFEFDVTNVSAEPVAEISFGWMLRPANMTQCPANLATNETLRRVLQPGQTFRHSITVANTSETPDPKVCIRVTDMRSPYRWEK